MKLGRKKNIKDLAFMWLALFVAVLPVGSYALAQGGETVFTLEQMIQSAETNAPAIQQSKAALAAQDFRQTHSWLNVGPKLQGTYNRVFLEEERKVNFGGNEIVMAPRESRTASLTLSQPLTGALTLISYAQYEGLKKEIESQKNELTKAQIRFATVESFYVAQNALTLRKVAEEAMTAANKQVADGKSLFNAGRIHRGDLLKLELFLSSAKAQLAQVKAAETGALTRLKALAGLDLEAPVKLAPTENVPALPQDQAVSEAVKMRMDVKSAERGIEVSQFGKKLARSEFFPSVNAFAKIDYNLLEPVGLGGSDKVSRTYGVQATWNLWNNGVDVYKTREAAQQVQVATAGHKQALDNAKVEILSARADLSAAKESMELANSSRDQAREAYRIEQVKFTAGKSSATELILADSARTAAEGNVISANTDHKLKLLKLQKALGFDMPKFEGKTK
jgi:outer membrane protein TolC